MPLVTAKPHAAGVPRSYGIHTSAGRWAAGPRGPPAVLQSSAAAPIRGRGRSKPGFSSCPAARVVAEEVVPFSMVATAPARSGVVAEAVVDGVAGRAEVLGVVDLHPESQLQHGPV